MSQEVANAYTEETVVAAGEWLVSLCGRNDSIDTTRALTQLERAKFDEFFTLHGHSAVFKPYHVEAVRKCLRKRWKPDYQLTRSLLDKDNTGLLFAEENDILQVAIEAARIEPGWLGNSPKESCPELMEMVKLLISHGASPRCLDDDGNSALSYACILGYPELFHFLVSAGALLSTVHPRRLPEQLKKPDDSLNQQEKVNLLQVTLDALISPQDIVDMTWVGYPPGVNYDRPLWQSELNSTWGGIILHLLKAGLSYARDDPGLIMLLHIACYEGELGYIEQLLGLGIATNVAGPRMVNGGQGKGNSYGTALHAAAANKQLSSAKLLVAHGESPRVRAPCISQWDKSTDAITPTEIALSLSRYDDDDMETLLAFLEGLMQHEQGLEDSDHQKILKFCAKHHHIDFVTSLLQRGILPEKVPANVGSAEMAQLLISHGASIDAAAVQKKALNAGKLSLLRWCVDEYGPQLVSDPETWGNMGYRMLNCGLIYLENIKYLASEYPGSHIDAVLIANLSLGDEDPKPTPTSWLHMAALRDNIWAL
ncbi:HET domain-containing protein [Fusarium sp. LHS14.1]|nr:HET domain-containing protein [Fusarium sp. LHS14.1]